MSAMRTRSPYSTGDTYRRSHEHSDPYSQHESTPTRSIAQIIEQPQASSSPRRMKEQEQPQRQVQHQPMVPCNEDYTSPPTQTRERQEQVAEEMNAPEKEMEKVKRADNVEESRCSTIAREENVSVVNSTHSTTKSSATVHSTPFRPASNRHRSATEEKLLPYKGISEAASMRIPAPETFGEARATRARGVSNYCTVHAGISKMITEMSQAVALQAFDAMHFPPQYVNRLKDAKVGKIPFPKPVAANKIQKQQELLDNVITALQAAQEASDEFISNFLTEEEKRHHGLNTHTYQDDDSRKDNYQYYTPSKRPEYLGESYSVVSTSNKLPTSEECAQKSSQNTTASTPAPSERRTRVKGANGKFEEQPTRERQSERRLDEEVKKTRPSLQSVYAETLRNENPAPAEKQAETPKRAGKKTSSGVQRGSQQETHTNGQTSSVAKTPQQRPEETKSETTLTSASKRRMIDSIKIRSSDSDSDD